MMAGAIFISGAICADKEIAVADAFTVDGRGELWEFFAFLSSEDKNALLFLFFFVNGRRTGTSLPLVGLVGVIVMVCSFLQRFGGDS